MAASPATFEDIPTSVLVQPEWVKKENNSFYEQSQWAYVSSHPKRHVLGLVGGNEVSLIKGNITDLESDLTRRTRPLTRCTPDLHKPIGETDTTIERKNRKDTVKIDISKNHLPAYQMWAYPVVMAPAPLKADPCLQPHKY